MPSNLDILAANDFERNPFLRKIVRLKHGDPTKAEPIDAVVQNDSIETQSANSYDGGLDESQNKLNTVRGAAIEVAPDQETCFDDQWQFDGMLWKAVGEPTGEDAGSKTIALRSLRRLRGRQPNVNTQA
jgi:hypothetical protein